MWVKLKYEEKRINMNSVGSYQLLGQNIILYNYNNTAIVVVAYPRLDEASKDLAMLDKYADLKINL